jgi:hypothetical protein
MRGVLLGRTWLVGAVAAWAACGSDLPPPLPDPGPTSGIDPGKMLNTLTKEEAVAFCDWTAGRFGGYGRGVTCSDGTSISARGSQAQCVSDWMNASPSCPLSVGDFEECVNGAVVQPRCATVPPVCIGVVFCKK